MAWPRGTAAPTSSPPTTCWRTCLTCLASSYRLRRHPRKPEGVATFEFPHLLNLIRHVQFDTIYHEHFSYLSLLVVERVLAAAGLRAFDVEQLPTHGGSLRLYCCLGAASHAEQPRLAQVRTLEAEAGLTRPETYDAMGPKVATVVESFEKLRGRRRNPAAAALRRHTARRRRATPFLNACGITPSDDLVRVPTVAPRQAWWQAAARQPSAGGGARDARGGVP